MRLPGTPGGVSANVRGASPVSPNRRAGPRRYSVPPPQWLTDGQPPAGRSPDFSAASRRTATDRKPDDVTGSSLHQVTLVRDLEGSSPYDRNMPSLYEVSSKAMQNSQAETEDQLHPLREVPRWTWPSDDDGG
jgi:hypothetical protein